MAKIKSRDDALRIVAQAAAPAIEEQLALDDEKLQPIVPWAEANFYVPDPTDPENQEITDKRGPIRLQPFQRTLLNYMFDLDRPIPFQTLVWSTVKKSGKTTIAGLVARYVAECWGPYSDVVCVANDHEQARGRIYEAAMRSIELTPGYDLAKKTLPNRWKILQTGGSFLPDHGKLRAIASDYKGEAGANPTAAVFTELWGFMEEKAKRLYAELTPPPTRKRSIRFVEGYAGFDGESILWRSIWDTAQLEGRQLTREELEPYGGWPFADEPPVWVNEAARMCAYIDTGVEARRMPWQTPDYYAAQVYEEPSEEDFRRHHLNEWTAPIRAFIPKIWWDNCDIHADEGPLKAVTAEARRMPSLDKHSPVVLGVDASVTGDCSAIVVVGRAPWDKQQVCVYDVFVWTPPKGGSLDYSTTIDPTIRDLCKKFNVVQVAYDPYQLHKLATDLMRDGIAWCKSFNQTQDRSKADKQLYDLIRDRKLWHPGLVQLSEHIQNAAAKVPKDENTRLRIIKREKASKIDAAVALSMACAECLRLNLV